MTRKKLWAHAPRLGGAIALATVAAAGWLIAADHKDSPLATDDAGVDIADVYSFLSPTNPSNLVLAMTLHGFITPEESNISIFDPHVLYQIKIDNDGDAVEDLVIQAFVTGNSRNQVMHVIGPTAPNRTGAEASVAEGSRTSVRVSTAANPIIKSKSGMTVFAGVRDDPFFFDLGQFRAILAGQATGFNNPGFDSFAGFNVYAIVIELPVTALGDSPNLGIWGTTSRR